MTVKPRAIVSVTNDLYTDNRVDKICGFLVAQGYDVILVGRKRKNSLELEKRSYSTKRFRLIFDKGPFFYAEYNFRLFSFLLFEKADLFVSNDLDTLLANFLASRIKRRVRLTYDSHEFFTEVPELMNRPIVQKIWRRIEKYIYPKLKSVYTVNDSIANSYRELYGNKVAVVRNIAPKWNPPRNLNREQLGLPKDQFIVILQGAGINVDRGAEEAVEAMKLLDNVVLIVVGDGDVVLQLKKSVKYYDLVHKVLFFGKRPYYELMKYTAMADVGLTLDKPTNLNYRFSLPNKVFDYMHAGTPIICTNLPEVRKVVEKHNVGIVLEKFSVESLALSIRGLQNNPEYLRELQKNCTKAATIESWEGECQVLEKIYPKVGK